ncbi:hypothetical protein ACHAPF_010183 [Botrytis cinerea]
MGPPIVPAVKAGAKRFAKKIGISASQNKIQKPQVTNAKEKTKAKTKVKAVAKAVVKAVNNLAVPSVNVRRSAREKRPKKPYDRSIIDSGNLMITKPKPMMNGKDPDWANPKSEHWNVDKFLKSDSMVPKTNLDARPPKDFQFISNNSIRNPETYRPDKSNYFYKPKEKAAPVHPKLQAHIKKGTDTKPLRQWYADYEPGQINPIAGRLFDDNQLPPPQLKRKRLFPLSYSEERIEEIMKPPPKKPRLILKNGLNKSAPEKTAGKAVSKTSQKASLKNNGTAASTGAEKRVQFEKEMMGSSEVRGERLIKTTKKMLPRILNSNIVMERRDFNYLQEENFHNRPSINLVIPDHIKAILVDDWENVTKNQQLVPLPHKKSVDQILNDWLEFEKPKRPVGSAQADILEEIVAGLKEYFERCLPRILLYRFERQQHMDFRELWDDDSYQQSSACDTYGAEHLCRLLVTLPELIAQTNMDLQSVNRLREELSKLTNWIGKNAKDYFVNEYETPGAEYVDKARNPN